MSFFKKEKRYHDSLARQRQSVFGIEKPELAELVLSGLDCDRLPNFRGDFGHFYRNPIITNGIHGTLIYFSKLVVEETKQGIMFHRLGEINNMLTGIGKIDIYEVLDESGKCWDILFVDMYHPRRSNLAPNGYYLKEYNHEYGDINNSLGSYEYCQKFPEGLPSTLMSDHNNRHEVVTAALKNMKINKISFEAPENHRKKVEAINLMLSSQISD